MKAKKFAYEVRFFGYIFVSMAEKILFLKNQAHTNNNQLNTLSHDFRTTL